MLKQVEGSRAVAEAVALCRPQVVCAYPISPQTHIVEALGARVKSGELSGCEFINVESEFAAMSVAIGSSAAGARSYTATASQGLLYMTEAVYNAAGMGLPIVMTLANRAIGAPINIWNDHSDAMALRDSGWIQLFAEDNQEALDLHIQAFRLAEELSLPVMVCMDGFLLTHAVERVDVPSQDDVDAFLPSFVPQQVLDPDEPMTIGAMVGPEAFTEVRYLAHLRHLDALERIEAVAADFGRRFGRSAGGHVRSYRTDSASVVVVAMGSVLGTIKDAVDELREHGVAAGALGVGTYRPFPGAAVAAALEGVSTVIVVDRSLAAGTGGVLAADVRGTVPATAGVLSVIAGLGGRPVTRSAIRRTVERALAGDLDAMTFLDLDRDAVARETARLHHRAAQLRREPAPARSTA